MAWKAGFHTNKIKKKSELDELFEETGYLSREQAQAWFAKLCRNNPYLAIYLFTGEKIHHIQDLMIRGFLLRDYNLLIAARGFSKTFTVSAFIVFYAMFNPGVKIGICSGGFRQAKLIFEQIENWINSPKGKFLKEELVGGISHQSDTWKMKLGKSFDKPSIIKAIPLTDKIRGERFNLMIIDELALVPDQIMKDVIIPFMSVRQNSIRMAEVRKAEDALIEAGEMEEDERLPFLNNKLIGMSSATFKSDDLYKKYYSNYTSLIEDPKATKVNHSVWRMSWEAAPPNHMAEEVIEEARRTNSGPQFDREYRAIFTDDSAGYFSPHKIDEATVPLDGFPKNKIKGDPDKVYIMGIDPNNSDSELSDNFAMCLLEVDPITQVGVLVHSYALSKSTLKARGNYIKYLLNNFRIVYICIDSSGGTQFLQNIKDVVTLPVDLSIIPSDLRTDEGVREAKKNYNLARGAIVHAQAFGQDQWKLNSNDAMLADIEQKKLMFGSPICYREDNKKHARKQEIPMEDIVFNNEKYGANQIEFKKEEFLEHIDQMVQLTKKELLMIDIKHTANGNIDFRMPKGSSGPDRMRRDSYTALLLANWGKRCYFQIISEQNKPKRTFSPILV